MGARRDVLCTLGVLIGVCRLRGVSCYVGPCVICVTALTHPPLQEKDRLPPPFQRTSSKEERSSARLRRQPSRLEEEAVTPLLRGDEERGLGEEDELSSSAEKEPTESPTPVPIPTSSNQIADPQQPISPSQTTHSSLSPVPIGEGRSSSTQPMLGGGGEEVYEQEELEVKGSFEENEYKIPETLADLDFPEGKAAQSQSNRYFPSQTLLAIHVHYEPYMLPSMAIRRAAKYGHTWQLYGFKPF